MTTEELVNRIDDAIAAVEHIAERLDTIGDDITYLLGVYGGDEQERKTGDGGSGEKGKRRPAPRRHDGDPGRRAVGSDARTGQGDGGGSGGRKDLRPSDHHVRKWAAVLEGSFWYAVSDDRNPTGVFAVSQVHAETLARELNRVDLEFRATY